MTSVPDVLCMSACLAVNAISADNHRSDTMFGVVMSLYSLKKVNLYFGTTYGFSQTVIKNSVTTHYVIIFSF